jgi:ABC-2 type transport system permease protein
MDKVWLIIKREYITRIRKRSFLVLTLLTPLGMAMIILLPLLLYNLEGETQRILVKDDSGYFGNLKDTTGIYFGFEKTELDRDSLESLYEDLGYTAFLYIPNVKPGNPVGLELMAPRQVSMAAKYYIESALESSIEQINLKRLGLDKQDLKVRPDIDLETGITGKGRLRHEGSAFAATVVGYFMGFAIYVVLLIYGTMVMRGVMEEKSSRIVEVIITSVRPFQLMLGKILGIGAVGLTQFSVWMVLGLLVQLFLGLAFSEELNHFQMISQQDGVETSRQMERMAQAYASFNGLPFLRLFAVFSFYFLGGYLLYSALFAAVGSLTNDDGGDGQLYIFPVTLPIILSIIVMIFVIQHPNSRLAFWASIIPLSSPIVMPARMPFIGVLNWEVALSMGLLILGFIASTALAARVYRTGILLYGKKIRPGEVWRWLWKA